MHPVKDITRERLGEIVRAEQSAELRAWDRQPGEPDAAWRAFVIYRDMPVRAYDKKPRSHGAVSVELETTENYVNQLAAAFKWTIRVAAYDRALDRVEQVAVFKATEANGKRYGRLTDLGKQLLELELPKLVQRSQAAGHEPTMTAKELVQLLEALHKIDRLIDGEPTEHVRKEHSLDLARLAPEQLRELDRIRRIARGETVPNVIDVPAVAVDSE